MTWSFEVRGVPVPQGNLRSFQRGGKVFTATSGQGRLERWRGDVRAVPLRLAADDGLAPLTGPVRVQLTFRLPRPASHYLPANSRRPTRVLRLDAPEWHTGAPDVDKLERACLDALIGVCYRDDGQVAKVSAAKVWADPMPPGVGVVVVAL